MDIKAEGKHVGRRKHRCKDEKRKAVMKRWIVDTQACMFPVSVFALIIKTCIRAMYVHLLTNTDIPIVYLYTSTRGYTYTDLQGRLPGSCVRML